MRHLGHAWRWHPACIQELANVTDAGELIIQPIPVMPKYVIERNIPNAGQLSAGDLHDAAARSCRVLRELGPQIQWVQSYVTDNKLYCVYLAPNPELIREHALRACFPADSIAEIRTIIDPATGE